MKVVIFCGGIGARLGHLTEITPKPLINIGGKPVLWHIMKFYAHQGFDDFILCLGYQGDKIKEYFEDINQWKIEFVETGLNSNKAERLKKIKDYIKDEDFFVAYGDDLSNVDLKQLLETHKKGKKIVTLTSVNPKSDFGIIELNENNEVLNFKEKPKLDYWINGGYYIFNRKIFDYIQEGEDLEKEVFEKLTKEKQIQVLKHKGFWKSMNTFKDVIELNNIWENNEAKWKIWGNE